MLKSELNIIRNELTDMEHAEQSRRQEAFHTLTSEQVSHANMLLIALSLS